MKKGHFAWIDYCPYCKTQIIIHNLENIVIQCGKCKRCLEIRLDIK